MGWDLDARQRAMLEEMHIRVWWPAASPQADGASAQQASTAEAAPVPAAAPTSARQGPARAESLPPRHAGARFDQDAAIPLAVAGAGRDAGGGHGSRDGVGAGLGPGHDWTALAQTVSACTACALWQGRKAPVFSAMPALRQADWMVVGEPPDEDEEHAGQPFAAQAGELLDNMLRAVGVSRTGEGPAGAWLSNVVKCRPAAVRNPSNEELALCAAHLRAEVALVRPRVIVAMGRFATLSLLGPDNPALRGVPLGRLRGSVHSFEGVPVVVSLHPARLLRAPMDKALAWADLCVAREIARAA